MSARTPNEEKALAWYCESNDLIPQLSTHPTYYFRNRQGEEVSARIDHITMNWQTSIKEDQRNAKLEKKRQPSGTR